jgi:hypothetical protein
VGWGQAARTQRSTALRNTVADGQASLLAWPSVAGHAAPCGDAGVVMEYTFARVTAPAPAWQRFVHAGSVYAQEPATRSAGVQRQKHARHRTLPAHVTQAPVQSITCAVHDGRAGRRARNELVLRRGAGLAGTHARKVAGEPRVALARGARRRAAGLERGGVRGT